MSKIFLYYLFSLFTVLTNAALEYSAEKCKEKGFNKVNLVCSTCKILKDFELNDLIDDCEKCCMEDQDDSPIRYANAVLEVCTCKFGAYPQVQAFVQGPYAKKHKNLKIKYIRGRDPIIKLYDEEGVQQDILDIHKWDTDSIDEFFETRLIKD